MPREVERVLCPPRAPPCGALPRPRLTSCHSLPPVACSTASITGVGLAVSADEAKVAVGVVLEMSEIDGHPELEPRRGVLCLTSVGEGALSALSQRCPARSSGWSRRQVHRQPSLLHIWVVCQRSCHRHLHRRVHPMAAVSTQPLLTADLEAQKLVGGFCLHHSTCLRPLLLRAQPLR